MRSRGSDPQDQLHDAEREVVQRQPSANAPPLDDNRQTSSSAAAARPQDELPKSPRDAADALNKSMRRDNEELVRRNIDRQRRLEAKGERPYPRSPREAVEGHHQLVRWGNAQLVREQSKAQLEARSDEARKRNAANSREEGAPAQSQKTDRDTLSVKHAGREMTDRQRERLARLENAPRQEIAHELDHGADAPTPGRGRGDD